MSRHAPDQTNFRRHDEAESFTIVSNAAWKDETLSLEARGLLISLVTLPKDWLFNRTWAMREFKVGRDKLDRIVGELRASGYIVYVRPRGDDGKLQPGYYLYAANPESLKKAKASLESGNHNPEKPAAGKNHPLADPAAGSSSRGKNRDAYIRKDSYKERNGTKRARARISKISPEEAQPAAAPCPPPALAPAAAIDWRNRLIQYRKRAIWAKNWGPPMHAPGCLVPPDLVREWDATSGKAFTEEEQKPAWQGRKKRDWQAASSAIN